MREAAGEFFFIFRWTQFRLWAISLAVNREWLIQGRLLGEADVALISHWLQEHPSGNRTRLSRELCQRWNWRNGAGRLKDMACRSLLLKLEARGLIRLPARRTASVNGLRNRQVGALGCESTPICCGLREVRPLQVEVAEGGATAALFRALLGRCHYLGYRNTVGENLKYLLRNPQGRPLGALLFGAAAWKCAPRDLWIGWSPPQRQERLFRLANNTRFLILPWVRVPHLASHALGVVSARLSADWQRKYGHPIDLLETFVERERFPGTCYQAAGWRRVGATTGRTRNDDRTGPPGPLKEVFLKPLSGAWKRRLAG